MPLFEEEPEKISAPQIALEVKYACKQTDDKQMRITRYQQIWDLWLDYKDVLYAYVLKRTKNIHTTEDIVQEILIKTHHSCCSGIEIKNARSWLFQIAYHTVVDYYNQINKEKKLSSPAIEQIEKDIYRDLSFYLKPLIGFLPSQYATPLELAAIQGMKQQDIADKLNLSLPATKSRIRRARKMLEEEIRTCFWLKQCNKSGLLDFDLKDSCESLQKLKINKK